jgi:predicted ribosome quality control (RQC) complex YloA/Tae2 family protein
MNFKQDDKTKKFVEQVKTLVNKGIEPTYKTIAERIGWHSNSLSVAIKGGRNVPYEVYKKFLEIYKEESEAEETDWRDEQISLLKEQNLFLREQVQDLRERMDARTAQLQSQLEQVARNIEKSHRTTSIVLAYAQTLYKASQNHWSKQEGVPLKEIRLDMDRLLDEQLDHALKSGNQ